MTDISLPVSLGNKGLFDYLQTIKRFPVLEPEEEYMLAKRYHDYQGLEAPGQAINSMGTKPHPPADRLSKVFLSLQLPSKHTT